MLKAKFLSCNRLGAIGCLLIVAIPAAWAADAATKLNRDNPPFTISGTVITAKQKSALIKLEEKASQQKKKRITKERWLHEGESFEGYRVVKINKAKVIFEHNKKRFTMLVGYGRFSPRPASSITTKEAKSLRGKLLPPSQSIAPALPVARDREIKGKFIPPPENINEIRANAQTFLDQLRKNPAFMKKVEEMRPIIRKRLETANASKKSIVVEPEQVNQPPPTDNTVLAQ